MLLSAEPDDPRLWIGHEVADTSIELAGGTRIAEQGLARALREARGTARVVIVSRVDPSVIRALREHPPSLLILTGPADPDTLADLGSIAGMLLLGPSAALWLGPRIGEQGERTALACAAERAELRALVGALAGARLALAPTPIWLPAWLDDPSLEEHGVVGYLPAEALSGEWHDWAEAVTRAPRGPRSLLVPLGVPRVDVERSRHPNLEPALVAHALERLTGPIYPAPQVLALLRAGLLRMPADEAERARWLSEQAPGALALWEQARRALPRFGESPGMQSPLPELSLAVPTAAFLAQRTLLRLRAGERLIAGEQARPLEAIVGDRAGRERADAVLEGAAEVLSDHDSKVVLRGHGIEVTRQAFANSASGAASFADKIGYPVVLKALSPDLRRKTELGAVELDVANAAAVKRAYGRIVANVEERAPSVRLDGVVVAEMIPPGLDLHCGALRTRSGGVAVFARPLLDAAIEPVLTRSPLSPIHALLLAEAVLAHVPARRRAEDPDVRVLARLLLRLDRLFEHTGDRLLQVDLNPVRMIASEREYVILDARIVQKPHLEGL
ncbi:acetate--CoA ligase family protein [Nannocystaceae bacterium ST9]